MNEMKYQGYSAKIEYDDMDKIFVGHIIGIRGIVSFHGSTVEELESAFHEAVHHYLDVCEKIGQKPQRSIFRQTDRADSAGGASGRGDRGGNQQ